MCSGKQYFPFYLGIELICNVFVAFQVHVDAMDVAGDNQVDIAQFLLKQRVGADGSLIGEERSDGVGEVRPSIFTSSPHSPSSPPRRSSFMCFLL